MDSVINGYTVVTELNKGAFCDAYKVNKDGKDYFMKVYKDPTVMSADYKDFLKNQKTMIPLLKALGNQTETIVEDFEVAKEGRYYQIKEFIPGATNLRDWMETNFDFDQRLDVAIQFCKILKAVHEKNIVHQDLKPEQVMTVVDSSKPAGIRLILTDFDWSVPNGKVVRNVGTPGYTNIDGDKLSFKSDIFTTGIIVCELLTGGNPYILDPNTREERIFDAAEWVRWVKNKDYTKPIDMNDELKPEINNVIEKCLDPNQNNRPSLDEIIGALENKEVKPKKAKLIAESGDKLIMVPGMAYGRKHFKELFQRTTDDDGNLVYKYLDPTYAIVDLTQNGDQLYVSSAAYGKAKNKIMLNGKELTDKATPVNDGDELSVYSTGKGADVAVFTVQVV